MGLTPDSFRRNPRMLAALMISTALLAIALLWLFAA